MKIKNDGKIYYENLEYKDIRSQINNYSKSNSKSTPISVSVIQRIKNGVNGFVAGVSNKTWFGPNQPLQPQEPDSSRQYQYNVGYNIQIQPRADEAISFVQLRELADNYDLVRLMIETRKDQISALDFEIKGIDKTASKTKVKKIREQLRYPDNQRPWSIWLRCLIEDLLVIDAPALYPRMKKGGKLHSLDIIDGATMKVIIDEEGRTPLPPSPAYQQVLYGIPAVDFSRDEIIYMPRNQRSNKAYGYSPVEQIIMTINIALRRQISQLQYYTEGNIPDAMAYAPVEWGPDEIADFQKYFDSLLVGNTAQKRKMLLMPGGIETTFTKENPIKDEYDEWLARIVCFAFSIPPTAFIKQVNRSTAESAEATALQEGLGPIKQWVKELMDYILAKYFESPDLEFLWLPGESEQDEKTKSDINVAYVQNGILSANEVRKEMGLDEIKQENENVIDNKDSKSKTKEDINNE
jgi:hypothetical protein